MEANYLVIILVILLIAALGYIWYFRFYKKPNNVDYFQKHVRFADDNMSFLEPGYEQKRIDEMNYDIKYD